MPMSGDEVEALTRTLSARLAAALTGEGHTAATGRTAGAALVDAHLTDPAALRVTMRLVERRLPGALGRDDDGPTRGRLAELLASLAEGYARALREATMAEQERLGRAVIEAHAGVEQALRASEARFRAIFAGTAIGIGIADTSGNIVQVNQAFADMLGYTVEQMCALNVTGLTHPEDPPGMWQLYQAVVAGERDHVRLEKAYYRSTGEVVWTDLTVSLIRDDFGTPRFTIAMVDDVTDRHRLQQRLRYQALHDPLTGLPNRALFTERLTAAFDAAAPGTRVGVCYLDLDGFKRINDTLGHHIGDQLLDAVAARLHACASGKGHLVARMGGDEFVILVDRSTGPAQLRTLAESVLAAFDDPFLLGRHRLRVSTSIGVVEREVAGTSPAELMKAADVTLYGAKSDGRGRWVMYDPDRNAREVARYELASALPDALDRGEFTLLYQPLVSLADGTVRGVEALLRWRHPTLGLIGPDRFITLAEESGQIVPLGRWVLETACQQAALWTARYPSSDLFISVNVAVAQAHEPGFVEEVETALARTGLAPGLLQLELTESALMDTVGPALSALWTLSSRGIRVAIDDFGTGYSNLAYLRRLPVRTLKLAGSFLDGLREADRFDPVDEQIVEAIVRLAHAVGLTVTAENIETVAQADRLRALGCDTAQGWLFGRPEEAERIDALLAGGVAVPLPRGEVAPLAEGR